MIVKRGQPGKDCAGIGSDGEGGRIEAGERRDMLDTGRGHDDLDRLLDHGLRAIECRAGRQLHDGDEIALVLLRNEAGGRAGELEAGEADQRRIDHEHDAGDLHQPPRQPPIARRQPLEAVVEAREKRLHQPHDPQALPFVAGLVRLEQHRAKGGAQGQRDEARDQGRNGDRDRELAEELPGNARQEGRRHEHRAQRQRDRDQRSADLVHGDMRGLCRRHAALEVALDILHHHDGVVDDDADGEHKAEQRQIVQRNPERVEESEGADQRHRDGDDGNDRGAPALQEQEHNADHEQDRDEDRLDHLVD